MSILSAFFDNKIYSFEQAFKATDITGSEMKEAIKEWFQLYFDHTVTDEEDPCQRMAYVVVNKIVKAAFSEYTADTSTGDKSSKTEFMSLLLNDLDRIKKTAMQMALIGGDCFIKPVLCGMGFRFAVVRRDCFMVLSRDEMGSITSAGTAEFTTEAGKYYTLLERRTIGQDGKLTIESKLFRSDNKDIMGIEIPLASLGKYALLQPSIVLPVPLRNLGMVELKTPISNCVDGSHDGVSVYASAVGLIHNINRNERQINDEFENGASRIITSDDMLTKDPNGKRRFSDKLFVGVDDNIENVGITIFSPAFREQSYLARKTEYLRNMETQIGLKRGILSEVEAAERTATEITSSAGDYNLTIIDFQQMWENVVREILHTCDLLGQMYQLCDSSAFDPDHDVTIDWGDGVLFDRTRTWTEYMQMVQSGLLKPELAIAWYFDLPHGTPEELQKIHDKYMPEMEALTGGGE